jgi:Ca-activated chloride channel family protein
VYSGEDVTLRLLVLASASTLVMFSPAPPALPAAPAPPTQQVPVFRSGVDLVNLAVTVTDKKGNLVTDLSRDDFGIVEDGKGQTVSYFAGAEATAADATPPMHLGLIIDASESMGDDMKFTKTAAVKFLNTLVDAVDITLVDFDTEVRLARYGQDDFARLIERIRQRKATGWTALYDAVGVYLHSAANEDGRKIMLLYTDGGDTRSSTSFHELIDLLKASDVTVYAIGELEHQSSSGAAEARRVLQQVADTTGGQAFFPLSAKELDQIYDKVLAQVRALYTIGYLSTNSKTDGAWRKVEIKVTRKDGREYRVRSRKGYFAAHKTSG